MHCTSFPARRSLLVVVLAAAAAAACASDDARGLPTAPAIPSAAVPDRIGAISLTAEAVGDVLMRVLPALDDRTASEPLFATLTALHRLLVAEKTTEAAGLLPAVQATLDVYERRTGAQGQDAADLDAIRLALATVPR